MQNKKKLTEVSVSYFFVLCNHCCYGDIRDKIRYKENAKESNRDRKSYGTIGLSFKIAIGLR